MKSIWKLLLVFTIVGMTLFLVSCNDDDGTSDDNGSFDRTTLLTSMADGLIIPNFERLQTSVNALESATSTFIASSTEQNLTSLRSAWVAAATDYQGCSAFGFGPGELTLGPFASVLGVFPVDEDQVEANIIDQSFSLSATFDRDIRGFYAIEYLIYGNGISEADLISGFDQERKDYLELLVNDLKETFDSIVSEWRNSYRQEFITSDGTSAGSSISLFYNEFVKDYENLKNFKIELPAGLTAGQESADPTLVEAFYSGISTSLIIAHFENSKDIWYGRTSDGEDLIGFEEYLNSVVGGPDLIETTIQAIGDIDGAIAAIPSGPFSDHVESAEAETLRDLLQSNTANFKSSMSSLLGISITFNSGDGD